MPPVLKNEIKTKQLTLYFFHDKNTCPDGWVDGREIGERGGCYLFANDGKGVNVLFRTTTKLV